MFTVKIATEAKAIFANSAQEVLEAITTCSNLEPAVKTTISQNQRVNLLNDYQKEEDTVWFVYRDSDNTPYLMNLDCLLVEEEYHKHNVYTIERIGHRTEIQAYFDYLTKDNWLQYIGSLISSVDYWLLRKEPNVQHAISTYGYPHQESWKSLTTKNPLP
ncbi:MAG: hypothetical protein ACRCXZ_04930 [Patescibacteria group bacterium]